ncbi:MAG: ArsA family ATPase [Deltaproteobacteria bacterium]|nr:MAG: ArsA family ATPase [Deltaproteobacteria bacterium]
MSTLRTVIEAHRLIICVGAGGVGKTTVAASLALQAARLGRKVLVLTIDPARRLANSLGLSRFGNEPVRIEHPELRGELWAMMLDPHQTFHDLIERVSPDSTTAQRIFHNRVFVAIADSIAGSQDYMATEMLYDVVTSGRYDLVVLDTPPAKNALDFLDAPGRLARFTDQRIMKWFLAPYEEPRGFGRLLMGTSAVVFRLLGHIFGREFLGELSEFFQAFRDLYDGFRERSEAVIALFSDPDTRFIVVTAPTASGVETARFFLGELRARGMPCAGVAVNQRHLVGEEPPDAEQVLGPLAASLAGDLAPHTAEALVARLGAADRRLRELSALEARRLQVVRQAMSPGQEMWQARRQLREVHDVEALLVVGAQLLGP